MATGIHRMGLRSDDVNKLTRAVQEARVEGLGPDEAWARAKKLLPTVDPEAVENWRPEVEKQAEEGISAAPRQSASLLTRVTDQEEQIASLRRKLADAGAREEQLQKQLGGVDLDEIKESFEALHAKLEELEKDRSEKGAKLAAAEMEVARLTKENEELILGEKHPKKK